MLQWFQYFKQNNYYIFCPFIARHFLDFSNTVMRETFYIPQYMIDMNDNQQLLSTSTNYPFR